MNTFLKNKFLASSMICCSMLCASFISEDFTKNAQANTNTEVLENQDYRDLLKRADADDADALYQLADMYYYGESLPQNIDKAVEYAQRSARKNFPQAYTLLGDLYMQRDPATGNPNPQKAIQNYNKAVTLKDNYALYRLATIYYDGEGVPRDLNKAFSFYTRAANAGNVGAKHKIMEMTYKGEGTAKNPKKVFSYYLNRAKNGDMYSENIIGKMYLLGEGTRSDIFRAAEYLKSSANKGHTESQYLYAKMLIEDPFKDFMQAYAYVKLATELDPNEENQALLKNINGRIASKNRKAGQELYTELLKNIRKRR